jgi:hypothetical protein
VKEIPTEADPQVETATGGELTWRCHPAGRSIPRTIAVLAFHMLVAVFINWYTGSVGFAVVLTVIMFFSLSSFFFPAWYTLTEKGLRVKTLITTFDRPWSNYRSYWPDKNGVLLSPFPYRSRLENFRGLFVRFEDNGTDVINFVKRFVDEPESEEG